MTAPYFAVEDSLKKNKKPGDEQKSRTEASPQLGEIGDDEPGEGASVFPYFFANHQSITV